MGRKGFWIATLGILFGFAGGFFFANMLNRQEIDALKAKAAQAAQAAALQQGQKSQLGEPEPEEQELSLDEIKKKIQQADANPSNIQFQKDLGLSLYRYAVMQRNTELLPDTKRLMLRALEKDPKDFDLLVTLGNVSFDIGQSKQENGSLDEARDYYYKALEIKPKQIDLQTDIGSTYFLSTPPQYEKALAEYQKSLKLDPDHVRTLDNISRTLIMMGKFPEAEQTLAKLKKLDASYPGIADLEKLMGEKKEAK